MHLRTQDPGDPVEIRTTALRVFPHSAPKFAGAAGSRNQRVSPRDRASDEFLDGLVDDLEKRFDIAGFEAAEGHPQVVLARGDETHSVLVQ